MNWNIFRGVLLFCAGISATIEGAADRIMDHEHLIANEWAHTILGLACFISAAFFFGRVTCASAYRKDEG